MPSTATAPDSSEPVTSVTHEQLQSAEELTNELKRLLIRHENTLDEEGVKHQVETLERWMETYRRGIAAAHKMSETGIDLLEGLRNHLKLAADELQRLEGEGGNPASAEQTKKTEDLLKAMHRIERIMPDIETLFAPNAESTEAGSAVPENVAHV